MRTSLTKTKVSHGFTLIETFVAITILALATVGPLTIASRGLNTTVAARDQLIATYLAQEAIEEVRHIKDSNVLGGDPWLNNLGVCEDPGGCQIDVWESGSAVADCPSGVCGNLYVNTNGHYNLTGEGQLSPFKRSVWIEDESSTEKIIRVKIEWRSGSRTREVEIRERVFNWAGGIVLQQPQ